MRFPASLLVATLTLAGSATASRAGVFGEVPDGHGHAEKLCFWYTYVCYAKLEELDDSKAPQVHSPGAVVAPPNGVRAIFRLLNTAATLEPGEPTAGGRMNKTVWGNVTVPARSRVVIHTFGSDFDTALAVYTGDTVDALTRVTFNDNFPVAGTYTSPGFANKQSLVQFDARRNVPYSVQFGSVSGAEGSIYASVFFFPPTGGLAATLVALGDSAWQGQDYACGYNGDFRLVACQSATFLLHNSTDQTLDVTPSTDIDQGIKLPEPLTLAPGEAATVKFKIMAGFNKTKVRTASGHFVFTGRAGDTVVATAKVRGLIVVKPAGAEADVLKMDVSPIIQASHPNVPHAFKVRLENTGEEAAVGCHARSNTATFPRPHLTTQWRRIAPDGTPIGELNEPARIGPGKTALFDVIVASHTARVADPEFPLNQIDVIIDCANTQPAPSSLANAFDISALGMYAPAEVEVEKLAPGGDKLKVPPGGAVFKVSAINRSATTELRAIPIYIRPFEDGVDKYFPVSICRTATKNGPCLAPPSASVDYSAEKNTEAFFRILVEPPDVDPGFDPGKRRVFLKLWHPRPAGLGTFDAVVGAESVAVQVE
jgi:hypothetical protein